MIYEYEELGKGRARSEGMHCMFVTASRHPTLQTRIERGSEYHRCGWDGWVILLWWITDLESYMNKTSSSSGNLNLRSSQPDVLAS